MSVMEVADDLFTQEGRLTTFKSAHTSKDPSNPGKKPKSIRWPHRFLKADQLATAGFFFKPSTEYPDNVTCFLCDKSIATWEKGDDPAKEHLTHSPDCGWAIVAAVKVGNVELVQENPASQRMIDARYATFGERWPHERKKGWKCKTKQLVQAGWIYNPTSESDDWTLCPYCELGLDGWEKDDDPMRHHFKRSPGCAFFTRLGLEDTSRKADQKTKTRNLRASKASRLSTQSVFTTASEPHSMLDVSAQEDDSVLTTATNNTITTTVTNDMAKAGRKQTSRKPKPKKDETVAVSVAAEPEDDDFEVKVAPKAKMTRGKKRGNEAVEDPSILEASQQRPSKRQSRAQSSTMYEKIKEDASALLLCANGILDADQEVAKAIPRPRKTRAASTGRSKRAVSNASKAPLRQNVPDDDELDRALEADLERETDDGEKCAVSTDTASQNEKPVRSKRKPSTVKAPIRKATRTSKALTAEHTMFDKNVDVDDAAIEAELEAMEVEASELLKKASKTKPARKPAGKKLEAATNDTLRVHAEDSEQEQVDQQLENSLHDALNSSLLFSQNQKALAKKSPVHDIPVYGERLISESGHRSTSFMSGFDAENMSIHEDEDKQMEANNMSQATIVDKKMPHDDESFATANDIRQSIEHEGDYMMDETGTRDTQYSDIAVKGDPIEKDTAVDPQRVQYPNLPRSPSEHVPFGTPDVLDHHEERAMMGMSGEGENDPVMASATPSSLTSRKVTPSLSPQSSDAENKPPSSKPSNSSRVHTTPRIPLARTPTVSPFKRNIIAGLQSVIQWQAIDLDVAFYQSPHDEGNPADLSNLHAAFEKVKAGELSSPEKQMTVEGWINHNAKMTEENLRRECERMVNIFEKEGGRAMRVLEGIECFS